jgi:hypothetical protein
MPAASARSRYLYSPSKDDKFLVTANTPEVFGVHSGNRSVMLVFPALQLTGNMEMEKGITPATFSQWFIRTDVRSVDTRKWPEEAYYMWITLQLNMQGVRYDKRPAFHAGHIPGGPFEAHNYAHSKWGRRGLREFARTWIPRGATRWSEAKTANPGPRLTDIKWMQEEIQKICADSRILQKIKTGVKIDPPRIF